MISIMVWNYHDDDIITKDSHVELNISSISSGRVMVREYRIDEENSNAYTTWKKMGSPQNPTEEQYKILEASGKLNMISSPYWKNIENGNLQIKLNLPRQGVSLVQIYQ